MTFKRTLSDLDFCTAAAELGCSPEAIKTVSMVESKKTAFYPDGFPVILFERHKFWNNAPKDKRAQWMKEHPDICNPHVTARGTYGDANNQRRKYAIALAWDADAANKACSWGGFQELGENCKDYGLTINEFVELMKSGADGQLAIFVKSIKKRGIAKHLKNHDWTAFAKNYNGPSYKTFSYDLKMATAFSHIPKIDCALLSGAKTTASKTESLSTSGEAPESNLSLRPTVDTKPDDSLQNSAGDSSNSAGTTNGIPPNDAPPDPAQLSGKEQIVIETHKPQTLWEYIWAKISTLFGGELTITLAAQKLSEFQGLGFSEKLVTILIGAGIIFGLIAVITWVIAWWRKEHSETKLTAQMVAENSTAGNLVHFANKEDLPEWQKYGAIIIRRPEQGV